MVIDKELLMDRLKLIRQKLDVSEPTEAMAAMISEKVDGLNRMVTICVPGGQPDRSEYEASLLPATYRCTTCGCTDLPPAFRKVIAEYEALSKREQRIAYELMWNSKIHGDPGGQEWDRGWKNAICDIMRALLPSYFDAKHVGDIDKVLTSANDPESAEERPEAWSLQGTSELEMERAGNREARELLGDVLQALSPGREWPDIPGLQERIKRYLADD